MSEPAMQTQDENIAAAIGLMEDALRRLQATQTKRRRAVEHLESAIKCLKDPRERIHPSNLNSSNDG